MFEHIIIKSNYLSKKIILFFAKTHQNMKSGSRSKLPYTPQNKQKQLTYRWMNWKPKIMHCKYLLFCFRFSWLMFTCLVLSFCCFFFCYFNSVEEKKPSLILFFFIWLSEYTTNNSNNNNNDERKTTFFVFLIIHFFTEFFHKKFLTLLLLCDFIFYIIIIFFNI